MRATTTDRHGRQYCPGVGTAHCSIEGQHRIGFEKTKKSGLTINQQGLGMLAMVVAAALIGCQGYSGPPLKPWHTEHLSAKFTARKADDVCTFDDYLALADRLFDQLREEIYDTTETGPAYALVRYRRMARPEGLDGSCAALSLLYAQPDL
jgi:hypothetical protein